MSQAFTLGALQSFMNVEHAVPPAAKVTEIKYCENCSRSFTRPRPGAFRVIHIDGGRIRRKMFHDVTAEMRFEPGTVLKDTGQRYCPACRRNALAPIDDQVYRDQLPREAEMNHAHHLPKYDESIVKFRHQQPAKSHTPLPRHRRPIGRYGNWINRLLVANEKTPLSYAQMLEISGMAKASSLMTSMRHFGFQLRSVGHVFPRKSCMGPAAQIYNIEVLVH